ncbi:L-lysine exporter family protein LysE/ArgO [Collimonas sp. OK242]|jgi:L-lysine exporter family protein LysE/ArgO|uniref:LysE/ArgO family amino acid transporter n=1 Tax=Collimonas sp. OK242 TaxID=1798195 RepID=UPI00089CC9D7|nr:LysE/ArgO family amino acid transporter [Collimonas sp. OK242]SDY69462.1 L-lysine exporter family protein LysE/ArgO [Collimonas sp. OK242]
MNAAISGFSLGLSLILAIGAQNAFVLKQGLKREHVFLVCLTCAASDAILILFGVMGLGIVIDRAPWLMPVMRYGGAAFLILYGAKSFIAAWRSSDVLRQAEDVKAALLPTLLTCAALTWLNPHVYLDTVLLIGSVSTQFPGARSLFAAGAMLSSFVFFFSLGYAAAWLRPIFARPMAWRVLEVIVGITMWAIAHKLLSE